MSDEPLTYRRGEIRWYDLEKGEFGYDRWPNPKWLSFWPYDSDTPLMVAIRPQTLGNGASWALSGTETAPTLRPSVDAKNIWHGLLTDGVAKP